MNEDFLYLIIFSLVIIILGTLFIYKLIVNYQYISNFKRISWNNFSNLAQKFKLKIKEDDLSKYYLPIIYGKYRNRKIIIRMIEESETQNNKIAFTLKFNLKIPNVIWILHPKFKKDWKIAEYLRTFKIKSFNLDLIIGCNNQDLLSMLLNDNSIKENINKLNKENDFYSIIISSDKLKYYTSKWLTDINIILKRISILLELMDNVETILNNNPTIKTKLKTSKEKMMDNSPEDAFDMFAPKKENITKSYLSLFGFGIIIISLGIYVFIQNPINFESIFISIIIIWIGLLVFIMGYANYYYWKKWEIDI